jgi:hypothetical protein
MGNEFSGNHAKQKTTKCLTIFGIEIRNIEEIKCRLSHLIQTQKESNEMK